MQDYAENDNHVQPIGIGHVNIYLIKTDIGYILVDTGMPNSNKKLDATFKEFSTDPRSVQLIILTHGHLDHVGSTAYAQQITGAKVMCQRSFAKALSAGKIEPAHPQNFIGRVLQLMTGILGSAVLRFKRS